MQTGHHLTEMRCIKMDHLNRDQCCLAFTFLSVFLYMFIASSPQRNVWVIDIKKRPISLLWISVYIKKKESVLV